MVHCRRTNFTEEFHAASAGGGPVSSICSFAGSLGGLAMTMTFAPSASATACVSPVRYASSSNTIYLVAGPTDGGPWTLSQIHARLPRRPTG